MKLFDTLTSLVNGLANQRNPIQNNTVTSQRISDAELRAIYKTGIGSKICRLKAGYALDDTLQFDTKDDRQFYNARLQKHVKKAARLCVGFGRSIIVILDKGGNLTQPLPKSLDPASTRLEVFSGDMVTVPAVSIDLTDVRYQKPLSYTVRGHVIHHSRVIDFRYVEPPELDAGTYRYGGISEFELIRPQLIADGIVQRAVPAILEKNSTFFYKLEGFKDLLQSGQTEHVVEYVSKMEDVRSIYGAGIADKNDDIEVINQTLTNLDEADKITLRRLAMVTGLSYLDLVGEGPGGLNANGEAEKSVTQQMVETLQSEYLLEPIIELMAKFGRDGVEFKDNQGQTPNQRLDVETKVIDNAVKLAAIGEDYQAYLANHDLSTDDPVASLFDFTEPEDENADTVETLASLVAEKQNEA